MREFSDGAIEVIRKNLHGWFMRNKRCFPWRKRRTTYRVWVAEIMLQQTRTDQAQPYFERFMRAFPSLKKLAEASQQDVLKQWEGLGYYGRARKLHQAAQIIRATPGGRFPTEYEKILALPGVGPYTAAAIASLAMNLPHAVVDGNVIRVLSRLCMVEERLDTATGKKIFQHLADQLLDRNNPGLHNESMMELGALCCLPRRPLCESCPLNTCCEAYRNHGVYDYPKRNPRAKVPHIQVGAGVLKDGHGRILIAQRREGDMLGGLWEFPGGKREQGETIRECIRRELMEELGVQTDIQDHLITIHHAYSHFTMELHAYCGRIVSGKPRPLECADLAWGGPNDLMAYPMSKADDRIRQHLRQHE
ncbi:MAG: A/G-specific adenine glycosylase [Kiritimatiellae bacterium]|nr:A/G-specific adenine glycosylase [Kiritimatiellia bacterium]MDD4737093.1 A/G-specific adenine glycosylase [Kiritimatiellia bacterium]